MYAEYGWKLFQSGCLFMSLRRACYKNIHKNPANRIQNHTELPKNETAGTGEVIIYYALNDGNAKVEAIAGNISAYGYAPEKFTTGKVSLQDIVYEDSQEVIMRSSEHMKNQSKYFTYDCRILDKSVTPVWVSITVMPTYNPDGEATHIFIRFKHINKDKQLEHLNDTGENLFDTLKNTGEAAILTDTRGRINQLNPAAERMIGLSNAKTRYKLLNGIIQ